MKYSNEDKQFIATEIERLLSLEKIEPSNSPWRAQVVVAKDLNGHRKKRLCIDYSQSVNKYTYLDAYPLPHINEFVNKISQYCLFSAKVCLPPDPIKKF